jgi:two-component system invasion response regulator UvrY
VAHYGLGLSHSKGLQRMIRILVVDDHRVFGEGLRKILAKWSDLVVVGVMGTAEEALERVRLDPPEVVLMDLGLPGMDGIEATHRITAIAPAVKVICLTASDEDPYTFQFMAAGGQGYLTKGCDPEEIDVAIRQVLAGKPFIQPALAQKMALHLTEHRPDGCGFMRLARREFEVTLMILRGRKNPAICRSLGINSKTLSTHRRRVYEKLGVANDVELLRLAQRCGLVDKS